MASEMLASALGTAGQFLLRQQERQWQKEDDELNSQRDMEMFERKQRLLLKLQEEADGRMAATSDIEGNERVWRNKNGEEINRVPLSEEDLKSLKDKREKESFDLDEARYKNSDKVRKLGEDSITADINARNAQASRDLAAARASDAAAGGTALKPLQVQELLGKVSMMRKDVQDMIDVAQEQYDEKQASGNKEGAVNLEGFMKALELADSVQNPLAKAEAMRDLRDQMWSDPDLKDIRKQIEMMKSR